MLCLKAVLFLQLAGYFGYATFALDLESLNKFKRMKMKNFILVVALLLVVIACKKEEPDAFETTMRVNSYKQLCQAEGERTCYLVQEDAQVDTAKWDLFYAPIEGFNYQEGFVYTLKVSVVKVVNPPADGSDRRYILKKIIAREKV